MLAFAIFAVTFVAALIIAVMYLYPGSAKPTTIPGLEPASQEDGNLGDIARAGSVHEFLMDLHAKFGPIAGFWWGTTYVVSIGSAALFKEHQNIFDRPPELFQLFTPLMGPKCLQFGNGTEGRCRRTHYDKCLTHGAIKLYFGPLQQVADELAQKWSTLLQEQHVPLCQFMSMFALKSVLIAMFGEAMRKDKDVIDFEETYNKIWSELEHGQTEKITEVREKAFQKVLAWGFYFLATHPEVQDKVVAEIKTKLGVEDVNHINMGDLTYLRQVIDETLRCSVVAPYAARFQDFDSQLGGHTIPKKTPVIHALGVASYDETVWPLPNKFDPDRFSPENVKSRSNLACSPFGFSGKRVCPGQRFAYAEATVAFVTLLRKFKVHMVEGQVVTPVHGLVTHPGDEIWVTLSER